MLAQIPETAQSSYLLTLGSYTNLESSKYMPCLYSGSRATVIASSSSDAKLDVVKKLGAIHTIDYNTFGVTAGGRISRLYNAAWLDVHVEGNWTKLLHATECLAELDTAFKLQKILDAKHIAMSYYDGTFLDDNIPEAACQNCECQVFLNCSLVGKDYFIQIADIPLLPFQLLLLQRVKLYTATASETKLDTMMQEDLAATEVYIHLYPHRHEPCLLSPSQQLSVLRFASWIRDSDPDASNTFSRLSLGLSSTLIAPEESIKESDEARNALTSSE
ncbi:hypothetical protein IW262DRAFT_1493103 [Armillaria fumosa]|nr:hypothetical protein IW262DRAFT_1493103 [Armillaria fumosa]